VGIQIFCLHGTTLPIIVEFYPDDNLFFLFAPELQVALIFLNGPINNSG